MSLLQMSFSGAVMILVIVVLRALAIHKLPKRTFLMLWGVAAVRLLIPFSLPSVFSVYSLLGRLTASAKTGKTGSPMVRFLPVTTARSGMPLSGITPDHAAAVSVDPWTLVWAAGALAYAVFFAVAYLKCRREFRASLPIDDEYARQWLREHRIRRTVAIRQSDRISAPLTYGVFRPVILMPKTADQNDRDILQYVLTHEYVHIRRFDAVTKLALIIALCLHWFNPAVWIMYVLLNRDLELSCDEAVLCKLGNRTKSAYAMALIRMEETRSGLLPLCNHFSKNAMEERIIAIMKTRKTSLFSLIVAVALVIGIAASFATSAKAEEDPVQEDGEIAASVMPEAEISQNPSAKDGEDGTIIWTIVPEQEDSQDMRVYYYQADGQEDSQDIRRFYYRPDEGKRLSAVVITKKGEELTAETLYELPALTTEEMETAEPETVEIGGGFVSEPERMPEE
ncbi:MAG: M56 family metallopeptidase [Acutalibacter sp.]|nr:M56 family metallopeptidase [Acutalibacter sp.]